jgi:hypothetical protein
MPQHDRKLRRELAALTETVEALREELAILRSAAAGHHCHGCLCVHTYYPQPYTPPVPIWVGYPQVTCGSTTIAPEITTATYAPGTVTSGIGTAALPGPIMVN